MGILIENRIQGRVAPMDRDNVDTDLIIPKQFLKSIKNSGYAQNLFDDLRYIQGALNQDFVLNKPRYKLANILLTRRNWGCGSSREHASWALVDFGFRAIIAQSFADIFYKNALINGLLLITLDSKIVDVLFDKLYANIGFELDIDISRNFIKTPDEKQISFQLDTFYKLCSRQIKKKEAIKSFETMNFATWCNW